MATDSANACAGVVAYIALGGNLDDPQQHVRAGIAALDALPHTQLLRASSLYRTAPAGYVDQPDFINAVACVRTSLAARALLDQLLALERVHGRVRAFPNAPRTLDLDILLYDEQQIDEAGLMIPHPRMHARAFVLLPLTEIAPEITIPGHGRARDLLALLDKRGVEKLEATAA
jgi:2-amino-4-hydroxy-6-hydroxymethyldihydropteridine diphosphokinase